MPLPLPPARPTGAACIWAAGPEGPPLRPARAPPRRAIGAAPGLPDAAAANP